MTLFYKNHCCRLGILLMTTLVLGIFCTPAQAARPLKVVTTTTDLASIAKVVGGSQITVSSIGDGKEDPHFLQARPSSIVKARDAELWIRIGMELEIGWEPPIIDGSRNRRIRPGSLGHLDASERIIRLDVPIGRITRAMGDVHPAGNPHYWLDPLNGRIVAKSIAERLGQLMPDQAGTFQDNLKKFNLALDNRMFGEILVGKLGGDRLWALHLNGRLEEYLKQNSLDSELGGWLARLRPYRSREIITYHRSWIYLAHRFDLEVIAELEPKPGVPPSGAHLAQVMNTARSHHVKVILLEPFYSRKSADLVAGKIGATVLVCANTVGGFPEARDYLTMIDRVVSRLAEGLR